MKIGILGGSFNPPHVGHLVLAAQAKSILGLDKVIFIPCFSPPHKKQKNILGASLRLKMLKLAVKGRKDFFVSDIEIKRGGVSYTVDTLVALRHQYPRAKFYLIIGADLAKNFYAWKDYRRLLQLAKVVVASRGKKMTRLSFSARRIPIPFIDISSSLVRELVRENKSIAYLVPRSVEEFILRNKLYQERSRNGQH